MKICGQEIEIVESDPLGWSADGMGRASIRDARILINKNMNDETKRKTIFHEVIHIIEDDNALGLTETQVAVLALWLYVWMQDNKDFIKEAI